MSAMDSESDPSFAMADAKRNDFQTTPHAAKGADSSPSLYQEVQLSLGLRPPRGRILAPYRFVLGSSSGFT